MPMVKIMLVDDHEVVRMGLRTQDREGFNAVVEAGTVRSSSGRPTNAP
jgi:hypothetical protein